MEISLYDSQDYKEYLRSWLAAQPAGGYGMRGEFARAMGCQTAFVSQVLNGNSHLSLEQADQLSYWLGHAKEEHQFFLLLVQFTRAGTETLRSHFRAQLQLIREKRTVLKERLKATQELSREDHSVYFSSWMYAAVHAFLMIPPGHTKAAIARAFGLKVEVAGSVLEFLMEKGLARHDGNLFCGGSAHLHLGNESSMVVKHHLNWRLQAMHAIEAIRPADLHYSAVLTISHEDARRLRSMCVDFLASTRQVIAPSKEEDVCGFCLDLFSLTS